MAFDQGIPDKFSDCFTAESCAVKRLPKDFFAGFWLSDIPAHTDRFIDHIRHAGFQTYTSENAFRGGIAHLDRGDNKIGFVFVFRDLHPRTMCD